MKPNVPPPKIIPCRNCKSTKLIHKFRLTGPAAGANLASGVLDFFQCCDCSLVFSNLRLSEADLLELYGSSYFEDHDSVVALDRTAVTHDFYCYVSSSRPNVSCTFLIFYCPKKENCLMSAVAVVISYIWRKTMAGMP